MNIVAVDLDKEIVNELKNNLMKVFINDEIVAYTNPLEVIQYSQNHHIDVLFTDVRLTPIDGYELMKTVRKNNRCLVYIVSGSQEHPDDLSWMGGNGFYTKPMSLNEIELLKQNQFSHL